MTDAPIFAAVRKIVRRHSKNAFEALEQVDVDEMNAALKIARGAHHEPAGPQTLSIAVPATVARPGQPAGLSDADGFFKSIRTQFGGLEQEQVDGLNALLSSMIELPLAWTAYGLATAWWETARTMQPIHERGGEAYFKRMYDIEGARPAKARELGNLSPGDGVRYAGRGYVQLTGKANYRKAEAATGAALVANPDLAMKADVAPKILVWGMETGAFTGKSLAHYLPREGAADHDAFKHARKIINGQDRATEIADIALKYQRALQAGGWA